MYLHAILADVLWIIRNDGFQKCITTLQYCYNIVLSCYKPVRDSLIAQYVSCLSNWIVRDFTRVLKWLFLTASKKTLEFLVF